MRLVALPAVSPSAVASAERTLSTCLHTEAQGGRLVSCQRFPRHTCAGVGSASGSETRLSSVPEHRRWLYFKELATILVYAIFICSATNDMRLLTVAVYFLLSVIPPICQYALLAKHIYLQYTLMAKILHVHNWAVVPCATAPSTPVNCRDDR